MHITLPRTFGAGALRKSRPRRKVWDADRVDAVNELVSIAEELGWTGTTSDLQPMADFVWSNSPTDGVARLLEQLAADGLIIAPF